MSLFGDVTFSTSVRRANSNQGEGRRLQTKNQDIYVATFVTESLFVGKRSLYVDRSLGILTKKDVGEIAKFNSRPNMAREKSTNRRALIWLLLSPVRVDVDKIDKAHLSKRFSKFSDCMEYLVSQGIFLLCDATKMIEEFKTYYYEK